MFKYAGSGISETSIIFIITSAVILMAFMILGTGVNLLAWKRSFKKGKSQILKNILIVLIGCISAGILMALGFGLMGKEDVYVAKPTINKIVYPPVNDDDAKVKVGERNHTHIVSVKGNPKVGDKVEIKVRLSSMKLFTIYGNDKQKVIPKLGKHHYGVDELIINEIDTKLIKN